VAALTTGYTDAFRAAAAIPLLAAAITALVRTRRTAANPA
jgi:hypothetical protein